MRNCEHLMGEDADGDPCPLLKLFGEAEDDTTDEPGSLLARLEDFLKEAAPGPKLIDEVKEHLVDSVLKKTVGRIVATWAPDTVSVHAQRLLSDFTSLMEDKARFMHRIYAEILRREGWKPHHRSIYGAINDVLLAVIPVAQQYPHKPDEDDFKETLLHFQIKPFLQNFAMTAWTSYDSSSCGQNSFSNSGRPPITKIPTELVVPTMRRLGMRDLLDPEWNVHGEWSEILAEMNNCGDAHVVFNDSSDKVLEEKSKVWRNARNSITCRMMRRPGGFMASMPPPPQCFQYFAKCSVMECDSLETREKPHPIRCTRCYYFHFCSAACEQVANAFSLHACSATPPEKAEAIKRETEAFLGLNQRQGSNRVHESCNFCGTKRQNARGVLLQCTRCKNVAYCDKQCQAWDWNQAGHKLACKKKSG